MPLPLPAGVPGSYLQHGQLRRRPQRPQGEHQDHVHQGNIGAGQQSNWWCIIALIVCTASRIVITSITKATEVGGSSRSDGAHSQHHVHHQGNRGAGRSKRSKVAHPTPPHRPDALTHACMHALAALPLGRRDRCEGGENGPLHIGCPAPTTLSTDVPGGHGGIFTWVGPCQVQQSSTRASSVHPECGRMHAQVPRGFCAPCRQAESDALPCSRRVRRCWPARRGLAPLGSAAAAFAGHRHAPAAGPHAPP